MLLVRARTHARCGASSQLRARCHCKLNQCWALHTPQPQQCCAACPARASAGGFCCQRCHPASACCIAWRVRVPPHGTGGPHAAGAQPLQAELQAAAQAAARVLSLWRGWGAGRTRSRAPSLPGASDGGHCSTRRPLRARPAALPTWPVQARPITVVCHTPSTRFAACGVLPTARPQAIAAGGNASSSSSSSSALGFGPRPPASACSALSGGRWQLPLQPQPQPRRVEVGGGRRGAARGCCVARPGVAAHSSVGRRALRHSLRGLVRRQWGSCTAMGGTGRLWPGCASRHHARCCCACPAADCAEALARRTVVVFPGPEVRACVWRVHAQQPAGPRWPPRDCASARSLLRHA